MFHNEPWVRLIEEILSPFVPEWARSHPGDYFLHFGVSFVLVQVLFAVLSFHFPKNLSLIAAICAALALGIFKELIDAEISFEDLLFDIAGIATAIFFIVRSVRE